MNDEQKKLFLLLRLEIDAYTRDSMNQSRFDNKYEHRFYYDIIRTAIGYVRSLYEDYNARHSYDNPLYNQVLGIINREIRTACVYANLSNTEISQVLHHLSTMYQEI